MNTDKHGQGRIHADRAAGAVTLAIALTLVVLAGAWGGLLAQSIRVTPVARDGRVMVSFTLADGFDDDLRAAIRSGLDTGFTFDVELRRASALWLDRTIASAAVAASVRYDNLTRRYHVMRLLDGRVERTEVTDDEAVVRVWLTDFDRLPLFSTGPLEPNAEYYLRVRARASPRRRWGLWPWGRHEAAGTATFTFIP